MIQSFFSKLASPEDRGESFGAHFREEITANVGRYSELFAAAAGQEVDVESLGESALVKIREWAPSAADEIEAIAMGARLPRGMVAALNARTEIFGTCSRMSRGECSTILSLGATPDSSFAAQTWDWHEELSDSWLIWSIELPDGQLMHTLTEYGVLGKIGINSRGVAVLFNILHHESDGGPMGVPVHVIARRILETSGNLNDALVLATGAKTSASTSLTLVGWDEKDVASVCVETYPEGPELLVPAENGTFIRTNHFLSPRAAAGDREIFIGPDTFLRFDVLRRRMAAGAPASVSDCFDVMHSHVGGGGAVCAHPDPHAPMGSRYKTLVTVVLDLGKGSMVVREGGPCATGEDSTFHVNIQPFDAAA